MDRAGLLLLCTYAFRTRVWCLDSSTRQWIMQDYHYYVCMHSERECSVSIPVSGSCGIIIIMYVCIQNESVVSRFQYSAVDHAGLSLLCMYAFRTRVFCLDSSKWIMRDYYYYVRMPSERECGVSIPVLGSGSCGLIIIMYICIQNESFVS